jgi:hypothetical protein
MLRRLILFLAPIVWSCTGPTQLDVEIISSPPLAALTATVAIDSPPRQKEEVLPLVRQSGDVAHLSVLLPDHDEHVALLLKATGTSGATLDRAAQELVPAHTRRQLTITLDAGDLGMAPLDMTLTMNALDMAPTLHDMAGICSGARLATGCSSGNFLFCDDFESSSGSFFPKWANMAPVLDNYGDGGAANAASALNVATMPVCAGSRSAHVRAEGPAQQVYLAADTFANRPNPVYTRVFLYFPAPSTAMPFEFLSWDDAGGNFYQLGIDLSSPSMTFGTNASFGSPFLNFPGPIARDRWHCLETRIYFDANNGAISVTLDGAVVGEVGGIDTQPAGANLNQFEVGAVGADVRTGVLDLYIDEVAVSNQPIGCN